MENLTNSLENINKDLDCINSIFISLLLSINFDPYVESQLKIATLTIDGLKSRIKNIEISYKEE